MALHWQSVPVVRALLLHLDAVHSGLCPDCVCDAAGGRCAARIWRSLAVCLLAMGECVASLFDKLPLGAPWDAASAPLPNRPLLRAWWEVRTPLAQLLTLLGGTWHLWLYSEGTHTLLMQVSFWFSVTLGVMCS